MSKLTRPVTASLRRSWRPLALAVAMIVTLAVALGIAMAPPAAPPPLGRPVTVERPLVDGRSRPAVADRPVSERERSRSRPARASHCGQTDPSRRRERACSDARTAARPESPGGGARPAPTPTVPAAGDEEDDGAEVDDDERDEPDDADDD
jgi:hypothetical protein